jgi:hypothetical protein
MVGWWRVLVWFDSNDDLDDRQAYLHSIGFVMEYDASLPSFVLKSPSFCFFLFLFVKVYDPWL